jgi:hypothetical protein
MGWFQVDKAFYHAGADLLVLAGQVLAAPLQEGDLIDLPLVLGGPGRVPIAGFQDIAFADGPTPAVLVEYRFARASRLEPALLEGRVLEVCSRR